MMKKPIPEIAPCPCGNPLSFAECCSPFIAGKIPAPTAETLMRSRYTAHVVVATDYLWDTWEINARRGSKKSDIEAWAVNSVWQSLTIISTRQGQPNDEQGLVEFIARYRNSAGEEAHHEVSLFKKFPKGWRYVTDSQIK